MARNYNGTVVVDNATLQIKVLDEAINAKDVNISVKKDSKFIGGICITRADFLAIQKATLPAVKTPTASKTPKATAGKKTASKPAELTLDADMINALKKLLNG
jgi:hypothetical protein